MAEEAKDAMDELLDDEVNEKDPEDIFNEDLPDKIEEETEDAPEKTDKKEPAKPVDDKDAQLEALAKEKTGLYKEMIATRQEKQELKRQMDEIKQALVEIRESRKGAEKQVEELATPKVSGIPVKFDDDGNPYIDPKDLKSLPSDEIKSVKAEVAQMKHAGFTQEIADRNMQTVSEVMQKDERYPEAVKVLNAAYQYLDAKTGEVMVKHGLTMTTTNLAQAMDLLDSEFGDEFEDKFPGVSIDDVIEAMLPGQNGLYNGRKINKALKGIAATLPDSKSAKQTLNSLKLIAGKPSNLSGQRNQKGAAGRTLSDIANMSLDEFTDLSDADIKKLERALRGADA